jgi:hypothetical protein
VPARVASRSDTLTDTHTSGREQKHWMRAEANVASSLANDTGGHTRTPDLGIRNQQAVLQSDGRLRQDPAIAGSFQFWTIGSGARSQAGPLPDAFGKAQRGASVRTSANETRISLIAEPWLVQLALTFVRHAYSDRQSSAVIRVHPLRRLSLSSGQGVRGWSASRRTSDGVRVRVARNASR